MFLLAACADVTSTNGSGESSATGLAETGEQDSDSGDSDSGTGESGEDGSLPDLAPDLPAACDTAPDPNAPWVGPLQDELVARLTGAAEISPGLTLPDRASNHNRGLARDYLAGTWTEMGFEVERHEYAVSGTNIYTTVPATTDSEEWIVFGAHFDSVPSSPGANDNATGVAMVVAASEYAARIECRGVNWLFVLFDQEEIGLVGSAAFADSLVQSGIDVSAVHTVDQMGWDQDHDRGLELERPGTGLHELYSAVAQQAGLSVSLQVTQTGATDHVSFRERGFLAVGLTEEFVNGDTTPHYHQPSDSYATVDFEYLRSSTILFMHLVAQLSE